MTEKREIYSVSYNKSFTEKGDIRVYQYVLGKASINAGKVVKSITLKGDKVIVTFEDESRHIFFYNTDVELLDRVITKPKTEKKEDNGNSKANKTGV